jgi:hypothetical protein
MPCVAVVDRLADAERALDAGRLQAANGLSTLGSLGRNLQNFSDLFFVANGLFGVVNRAKLASDDATDQNHNARDGSMVR